MGVLRGNVHRLQGEVLPAMAMCTVTQHERTHTLTGTHTDTHTHAHTPTQYPPTHTHPHSTLNYSTMERSWPHVTQWNSPATRNTMEQSSHT